MNISYYGIRPNISQAYKSYASQSTAHKLLNTVIILVCLFLHDIPKELHSSHGLQEAKIIARQLQYTLMTQNVWTRELFSYTSTVLL